MLNKFEGLEDEKGRLRDRNLQSLEKMHAFKPTMRRDGLRAWLVDEVGGLDQSGLC